MTAQHFAAFPDYALFAIVDDPALKSGWDILCLITNDVVEMRSQAIGVAQPFIHPQNGSGTSYASVLTGERPLVVRRTQFLMGRKNEDVLGELTNRVSSQNEEIKKLTEGMNRSITNNEALRLREQESQEVTSRTHERLMRVQAAHDKLEQDMARLKKVLGEKAVADALA